METAKSNAKGPFRNYFAKEVARIEVGRYMRLYDLSGEAPALVFELMESSPREDGYAGPSADEHAGAVIDFFERLIRREVPDGN
jgi:hypothetical protein